MPHGVPPRRPLIGVTPDLGETGGELSVPRYELKVAYADAVAKAGGLPVLLPYSEDRACVDAYLDRVQGLVVTGGAFDVPPQAYGEQPREGLGPTKPARTNFETALLNGALARNIPLLGVCGGMQLLNVVLGGTLYQDLARELPTAKDHQQTQDRSQPHHLVDVKDGSQLAGWLGRGQIMVNSTHHQAVHALGRGVVVSAAAPEGVIEAIEVEGHPFALGVQWHPELLLNSVPAHLGIYKALVAKARERHR